MSLHHLTADPLLARILRRGRSLFAADLDRHQSALRAELDGARVLVIGAGGSIGSAFTRQVAAYPLAALHLVDLNENTLVEVVRDLRSAEVRLPPDLRSLSIDLGGEEFARFAAAHGPWDHVVNFSAMKHVRAERDPFSLMRMIDVNVGALHRAFDRVGPARRLFSVSTDKSVRPANLMGATKNLMERVLFCRRGGIASSARFANVAFSAGSLLEGFELRLAKGQPLAAPLDVRRYFISAEEAGQLCLLAAFVAGPCEVFFPRLDPRDDLLSFADIARAVLEARGLEPQPCADEAEAKAMLGRDPRRWPCLFSPSDTTGEKMAEEFWREAETPDFSRFAEIGVIREPAADRAEIDAFLDEIAALRRRPVWDKAEIVAALARAVPDLDHAELGRNLDQKM
ncbi:polysaccharide biosynthesis protein [Phaeospirillum tilakii]|uniref:Polysaccharide biosynthesis protein n=1 Tax=Phaeospirillum tilakii TaxID=741673 RepID=A0ABW5CF64_9PROT